MFLAAVFSLPLSALLAVLLLIMLASLEIGRRLGSRARAVQDEESRTLAGGLHAATLGLLGLLLGFAFSLSGAHFVTNRDLVAEEANAIDTAYRRADLAAEPDRSALRAALRRYLDVRIALYDAGGNEERRRLIDAESPAIHDELWRRAEATAERAPTCITALLVHSVNRVIELHETRADAARNHLPRSVSWLLAAMAVGALGLTGYLAAFSTRPRLVPALVMIVLIGAVLIVIEDLDRPMRGLVQGGQQSLIDLRGSLSGSPAKAQSP